jgi:NAD-dependent SIR2 family protein deacetylase
MAAKYQGAGLVIVNRDPTPLDSIADHVLRGPIGTLFSAL